MTLQDKTYVVTGASSGIGQAACIKLASEGASVVLMGRNEETLKQTLNSMAAPATNAHFIQCCDLAQPEAIQSAVQQMNEALARPIDGLVYCAGQGGISRLSDLKPETAQAMMTVNFFSFIECVRQLVKGKRKEGEMRIIGISSLASTTYSKHFTAYAASKAAMEAAVRTLSAELLKKSVHIFSIKAGYADTPMAASMDAITGGFDQHLRETGKQPMGLLSTENLAGFIHYLLSSPTAPYMTGTNIAIPAGTPC